ncbi:MAG: hypothetical protein WC504_08410 [Methylobacter sp.]
MTQMIMMNTDNPNGLVSCFHSLQHASDIERMGLERMPLGGYIKKSQSTVAYDALWQEILARVT